MSSPSDSSKASSLVYRVSGLPPNKSIEDIDHLLARALQTSYTECGLRITSLAVGHYQAARQVATVTFLKIPPALSGTGKANKWPIDLSAEEYDLDSGVDHTLVFDTHFHGLTPLNTPIVTDDVTDCLVICGLGGHAFGSFKEKGGSYMWLRDSLPKHLPGLRILLYGYDSGLDGSNSNQNVSTIADSLASHINELGRYQVTESQGTDENHVLTTRKPVLRPLVIIAHSLGGLVTKQAIIKLSRGNHSDKARIRSIAGLLFFGVPNRGMDIQSLQTIVGDRPNRYFLESVGSSSDFLLEQSVNFPLAFPFKDSPVFSFFETQTSPTAVSVNGSWEMAGPRTVLVDRFSATCPRPWDSDFFHKGLNRTHSDLVKFSAGDAEYQSVLSVLRDVTSKAAALITSRFLSQESADDLSVDERACLRSLSFIEIHTRESNIEPAVKDTGNWLLESADFQDWAQRKRLDQHRGFFWIKGNPGSGKSTLIKKAYANIRANSTDPSSIVTAFFFNARGSDLEKSPTGLFRTLLYSLCQQISALRAVVLRKYLEKSRLLPPGWEWHLGEIKDLLKSVITPSVLGPRNLVLFVDALDECELAEIKSVIRFFEDLASSAVREGTKINICLSSRYWPQFKIRHCFQTQVEVANHQDIETYIHNAIELPQPQEDYSAHLVHLRTHILEKASGIFLWVVLVVQELLNVQDSGATLSELQDIVRKVPSDLSGFYLHQLQSTSIEGRLPLLRLLQCVFYSQRPLSATELRYAMAFSTETFASYAEWSQSGDYVENDTQMGKRVCEISKGLVEIKSLANVDPESPQAGAQAPPTTTVQFIHESVRDFLQANGFEILLQPSCPNQTADGHDLMKRICVSYLKVRELAMLQSIVDPLTETEMYHQMPSFFEDHPLLEYMVNYIFTHAAHAEQHGIQQDDFRIHMGGNLHGHFQRWRTLYDLVRSNRNDNLRLPRGNIRTVQGAEVRPLHIFSQHGLLTQYMANKENNINIPGGLYQYAIHAAAANGNIDTVKLLLDTGADPEAVDSYGNTAIDWAAFREDLPLLSLFEDKLSLIELEKRLRITQEVQLETRHFYDVLGLLVPETAIPQSALDSVCEVARCACVRAFSFILNKCDRSILTVENLLGACRDSNFGTAKMVIALLEKVEKVKITPQLLSDFKSPFEDRILFLLFEKGEAEVDERLLDKICHFSISSQLISQMKAADIDIPPFTSQNIFSALVHGSAECAAFFIQHTDNSLHSDALFLAAATNEHYGGEVMRLLLGWRPTYRIGDDVVIAAVQNRSQSDVLLKTFIDRWDDLDFSVAALNAAVEYHGKDIVGLVYDRYKLPTITEDLLISATRNMKRDEVIEFLLERNLSLSVSQRLVDKAVKCCSQSVVRLVLDRCKCLIMTEDLLVGAAENWWYAAEKLDLLLEHDPTYIVSEPIMVAAVANYSAVEIIDMFLRRGKPLLLSEKVVEAAASNYRVIEFLNLIFGQNRDATISVSMIMAAIQGRDGAAVMSVMLRHDPSINMTEEALIAAAANRHDGSNIFAVLQRNGKINKPTLPTKSTETGPAKRWWTYRKRSSSHKSRNITGQITKNVIKAAAENYDPVEARKILALFEAWGVLKEADRKRYYGMMEEHQRPLYRVTRALRA